MSFPPRNFITLPDTRLAVYQAGPADGTPLLLVHGWPELAYSWKPLMGPLAEAGYRVIAYDLRGFGHSDAPRGDSHYQISNHVADIENLLDALGIEKAVVCGHDWGGIITWHAARMLAPRISRVISLCTPHVRRAPVDPMSIFENRYGPEHYFVKFRDHPETADLFAKDPDAFFRLMFRTTPADAKPGPDMHHIPKHFQAYLDAGAPSLEGAVMSDADRQVYVEGYRVSGFHGGMALYRNTTANWKLAEGLSDTITQPALMISAERDLFLPPAMTAPMADMVPDLTRVTIDGCGHWAMWDKPEPILEVMQNWLSQRLAS